MVDFLVIGPYGAETYNNIFPLIREETISIGYNRVGEFSDGIRFGNIIWFTSMRDDYPDFLILSRKYVEGEYKKFDNYDAINVYKTDDIPYDYYGVMGVPITFLDKWNPDQFELIGLFCDRRNGNHFINGDSKYIDEGHKSYVGPVINGKAIYVRLLIKRK